LEDAERVQFAKRLMKHNVSLVEYAEKMQKRCRNLNINCK